MDQMQASMKNCRLCPHHCGANRLSGETGICRAGAEVEAARAALHHWEEPCLSGEHGSGTVFFSHCGLHCVYCQNQQISGGQTGKGSSIGRLSEIFLELQAQNAHNINLVTPTHYVPQIIAAVEAAEQQGLTLPIVYNSSGYETTDTIRLLEGTVDIYLPDLKYYSSQYADRYSNAPDYFSYALRSITEMVRQVGEPVFDGDGILKKGVIIRHLMLPGMLEDSKRIIKAICETFGDSVYLSLMNQYTPLPHVAAYPEINRTLDPGDYEEAIAYALTLGLKNGFIQEEETAKESFIPDFGNQGV